MDATKLREVNQGEAVGTQVLWSLSEPYAVMEYDFNSDNMEKVIKFYCDYLVSSGVIAFDHGGPETFIFPSDKEGKILDWMELPGSQRGTLSHDVAIADFLLTCNEE